MHEPPRSERGWRRVSTAAVGAVCALWLVGVLWISRGAYPASPDTFVDDGCAIYRIATGGPAPMHSVP
jgi:hypothetical protein